MTPITSTTPSTLRWLKVRLGVIALVLIGALGAIGWKAWKVQIREGARMRKLGEAQYVRELALPAPRGSIRDTNGVELAVSVDTDSVYANPREIVDPKVAAHELAKALSLDEDDLAEKLASDRAFVWIKRRMTPDEAKRARELNISGLAFVSEPRRFYPGRELAGPVLGFAGLDGHGLDGVELALDDALRGTAAALPAMRDARGNVLVAVDDDNEPATAGSTVTLTIDRFLQYTTEQALAAAVKTHKAKSGIAVVMDPRTGDILALASSPTYDPNDPDSRGEARDRAVTDAFEPGSVMKIFTVASALEAHAVTPTDTVPVDGGRLLIGSHTIRDTHFDHELLEIGEVLKISSNVGAAKIGFKLGKDALRDGLAKFGFGTATGVELPGERAGRLRDTKRWGDIGLATISFGYGLTVTPLQIAAGVAAVANGGTLWKPHVVKQIESADGHVRTRVPEGHRVISAETAREMTAMLETVMDKGGTGEKLKVPGFVFAGKTGTANKVDLKTHHYALNRYLSSFAGFVPAEDPRLVIIVMIDEPMGDAHFGAVVAGPVFTQIAGEALRYLGVKGNDVVAAAPQQAQQQQSVESAPDASGPAMEDAIGDGDDDLPPAGPGEAIVVIPDFSGMSIAQAMAAARAAGVTIDVEGSGRAVRQFPAPGRAMKSIRCRITFDHEEW
jgi:cell division protein FtsI (penicillin-binding protein 3)